MEFDNETFVVASTLNVVSLKAHYVWQEFKELGVLGALPGISEIIEVISRIP